MDTSGATAANKSGLSCRQCRRLKRKCNRDLPSCSLCLRLGKPCGYPLKREYEASTEDPDYLLQKIQQLEDELRQIRTTSGNSSTSSLNPQATGCARLPALADETDPSHDIRPDNHVVFPKAIVLDAEVYAPVPEGSLEPSETTSLRVLETLQCGARASEFYEAFFATTHGWLPILSKKRLAQRLEDPLALQNSSLALLMLSMMLVTEVPNATEDSRPPLYLMTKQYACYLESSGTISLTLLQAAVLIAVYELGHGIYPAAYLSVSRAARLCYLMGLHARDGATQMFKAADTWTLCEEERRAWWAVLFLDRSLHCGTLGLPLITCEPPPGELLPANDISWNQGLIGSNDPLFTSTPARAVPGIHFATICRASHILGRVLHHKADRILEFPDKLTEAFQLHRALLALESSFSFEANAEQTKQCELPRALTCSARFILYSMYACNERYRSYRLGQETEMQKISIEGLSNLVQAVARHSLQLTNDAATGTTTPAPMVAHTLYQAACECAWFLREDPSMDIQNAFDAIVEALRCVSKRWRVALDYLKLIETSENIPVLGSS